MDFDIGKDLKEEAKLRLRFTDDNGQAVAVAWVDVITESDAPTSFFFALGVFSYLSFGYSTLCYLVVVAERFWILIIGCCKRSSNTWLAT